MKVHESQHKGKDCPKGGLGRFPDLKGVWQVKGGRGVEEGDFDTPINIFSNENNLKVMTNYYEKKCLLVITKNQKTWKQVVPITFTLEKRVCVAATFQGLCVVSFETK